jgi:hypothetical protein
LSITTDCLNPSDIFWAMMRATTSVVPPGVKPTSTRIGRVG